MARYTRMDDFTAEQWDRIVDAEAAGEGRVGESVLGLLRSLESLVEGFPVDQLTHACQTATRAERDGADEEVVVAALCHDVGKAVSWTNHGAISAEILKPYVSEKVFLTVRHHQDFQLRHYAHYLGGNAAARDRHRAEPWFDLAEKLCDEWDQVSFDPDYDTLPLAHFEPRVRAVFASRRPSPRSPEVRGAGTLAE